MPILNSAKRFVKNPGSFCCRTDNLRSIYKGISQRILSGAIEKRKRLLEETNPPLTPPAGLQIEAQKGFLSLDPERAVTFFPELRGVKEICRKHLESKPVSHTKGKTYLRRTLEGEELLQHEAVEKFLLNRDLLGLVTDYLGEIPILASVKILHSVESKNGFEGSQNFHCDHDDYKQIKLFLYLNDVDENNGPFTLIPAEESGKIRKSLNYQYGGHAGHVPDEKMAAFSPEENLVSIKGPAGTLSLVDTSTNFHLGSRVSKGERWVFFAQYVTYTSFLFNPLAGSQVIGKKLENFPYRSHKLAREDQISQAVLGLNKL